MTIKVEHELHRRRLSRNVGLGLTLAALTALVFGLTLAKVSSGESIEGFDHEMRPQMALEAGQ